MLEPLIRALSHLLVPMFLVGMAGSTIVVAITLIHDVRDFFADNGDEARSQDSLH